jgi:hypothetical protein
MDEKIDRTQPNRNNWPVLQIFAGKLGIGATTRPASEKILPSIPAFECLMAILSDRHGYRARQLRSTLSLKYMQSARRGARLHPRLTTDPGTAKRGLGGVGILND